MACSKDMCCFMKFLFPLCVRACMRVLVRVCANFFSIIPFTFYTYLFRKLKDQRIHEGNFISVFNNNIYSAYMCQKLF